MSDTSDHDTTDNGGIIPCPWCGAGHGERVDEGDGVVERSQDGGELHGAQVAEVGVVDEIPRDAHGRMQHQRRDRVVHGMITESSPPPARARGGAGPDIDAG